MAPTLPQTALHAETVEDENEQLRDYCKRLEAQLKAYQNKHGVQRLDEQLRENLDEEPNVLPPWVASKAALSPLLIAYDERIAELTTATEECASQLRRVTRELNDSSQENKRLQAELATKHEERIKSIERGLGRSAVGPEGGLDDLDEQLHVVLRENAVLTDQVTLFESEVARLTDEGKERDEQLITITENFQTAAATLQNLQSGLRAAKKERDSAHRQVEALARDLSALSVERDSLRSQLGQSELEQHSLETQIKKLRKSHEDVVARTLHELDLAEQQTGALSSRGRELKDQLDAVVIENDELKDRLRGLAAEHESTRRDCAEMVEVLNAHKQELNEFRSREEAVKELETRCQQQTDAATLEKEKAVARDVLNRKEIERLLDVITASGKSSIVEIARARTGYRKSMKEKVAAKEKEIHELVQKCAQQKKASERSHRDQATSVVHLQRANAKAMMELEKVSGLVSSLGERVELAERAKIESLASMEDCKEEAKKQSDGFRTEKRKLTETIRRVEGELTGATQELQSAKAQIRRLTEENSKLLEESSSIRQDLATMRLSSESQTERANDIHKRRSKKLEGRIEELIHKVEVKEVEVANIKESMERQVQHSSEELAKSINYYERMIDEFKEDSVRLRTRNDELSTQLFAMQQQNQHLEVSIQRKESSVRELQQAVKNAQVQTQNAKAQLSELLEDEEKRVKEMSDLRKRVGIAESRISRVDQNYDDRNTRSMTPLT